MKNEKMVEFSYRCKCGKMVQGWSAKQLTDTEMASLKEREDCESCLLKKLLKKVRSQSGPFSWRHENS